MADTLDKAFRLKVIADITAYQAEMAKIPEVTGKQAAAAALRMEREMVKAAVATGKAAQAAADAGVKGLEKGLSQCKEAASSVAAGVSKISPELGAVVNYGTAAAGVLKAMVSSMGPVGAAIALIGAATAAAAVAFSKWNDSLNSAATTSAAVTNEILRQQLGLADKINYATKAQETNVAAAEARQLSGTQRFFKTINDLRERNAVVAALSSTTIAYWWKEEGEEADRLTAKLDIQARGYTALAFETKAAEDAAKKFNEGEKETAKWLEGLATKEAKLLKEEAEAKAKAEAASKTAATAAKQAAAERVAVLGMVADREEAVTDYLADERRKESIRVEEERVALYWEEIRATAELAEAQGTAAQQQAKQRAKAHKDVDEIGKASLQAAESVSTSVFSMFQSLGDAASEWDEDNNARQNAMAAKHFHAAKSRAYAEAVINAALAISLALASAPPPLNFISAAAAGAAATAEVVKIAQTQMAHSGLAYSRGAPDEADIRVTKRERILTATGAQAMGGDAAIAAANSGRGGASNMVIVQNRYHHKSFDEFVGDSIARPATLRTAVRAIAKAGNTTGHRAR